LFALFGLAVSLLLGIAITRELHSSPMDGQDIYYSYVEGQRILVGENPYARVLAGDMRQNDKYANYFPLFYELSALSQLAGLREFSSWISFWRTVFSMCYLGIGIIIFWAFFKRRFYVSAVFSVAFWYFNRWSLNLLQIADLEFVSLLLVILSLEIFRKHTWVSLLLFSASLAVKHIAVLMIPLYLLWVWQRAEDAQADLPSKRDPLKQTSLAFLVIASIPLITSLPFILWNAEALVKSIVFEATRNPAGIRAIDAVLEWDGLPSRIFTLTVLMLAWLAVWREKIGTYISALIVQAALVGLNPVYFDSYIIWLLPFIPLAICDLADQRLVLRRVESVR
jgi:hypothetical protein